MAQAGPGDFLAQGGKSMTYKMPSNYVAAQIQEDFEKMDEGEFRTKYFVSTDEYARLKEDQKGLANLIQIKTVSRDPEPEETIKVEDKRPDYTALEAQREADRLKQIQVIEEERQEVLRIKAQPLGKNVLLWRIPEVTGFITIADVSNEKPLECMVISGGVSKLKSGDKVLIRRFSGSETKIEDHDVTIIHVDDILLKL
jgi:chaperonin GroES